MSIGDLDKKLADLKLFSFSFFLCWISLSFFLLLVFSNFIIVYFFLSCVIWNREKSKKYKYSGGIISKYPSCYRFLFFFFCSLPNNTFFILKNMRNQIKNMHNMWSFILRQKSDQIYTFPNTLSVHICIQSLASWPRLNSKYMHIYALWLSLQTCS